MRNDISGGVFFGAVVQGETVTVHLPPATAPALSGLPPASAVFTGREREIGELLAGLRPGESRVPSATLVTGLGGLGKTELAVQVATRAVREEGWFPGGVLFVDLFGYDPERRVSPEHALDGLLRSLGVAPEQIPQDLQGRSRLFRSALAALASAGRRILVVVDNAGDAGQATPLLPTDGTTATLLTSRDTLDLGARVIELGGLDESAAIRMLDGVVQEARGPGDTRVRDSPAGAAAVARACAGLPLALRIAAALLADHPRRPLTSLADALTAQHSRLRRLRRQERAVRGAFDLSYERLDADQARMFRLLSVNAGPDVSTEAAARLADCDAYDAEELLQDLARAHLIEAGTVWGRWRMHDLVRLYAEERGEHHAADDERAGARKRLRTYYFGTCAKAVSRAKFSFRNGRRLAVVNAGARFPAWVDAKHWLDTERSNLVAETTSARLHGHANACAALAFVVGPYLTHRFHFDDLVTLAQNVLDVANGSDDPAPGVARVLAHLGRDLEHHGSHEVRALLPVALAVQHKALDVFRDHGDRRREAWTLADVSRTLHVLRRFDEAEEALDRAEALYRELDHESGLAEVHWVRSCLHSRTY
ncbi:AAA family ATPase [Streptomyces longispororuber]|uniref:AAA family ATPase n=1 Tax=Streptomyces longispororuber TaxID=68230 RepID=UPI00210A3433|nr:ATP-binding protein [Streptomyces longispororuber]MCQ4207444.1 ATP-binding protein [Streptomyces longispororuber]